MTAPAQHCEDCDYGRFTPEGAGKCDCEVGLLLADLREQVQALPPLDGRVPWIREGAYVRRDEVLALLDGAEQ